MQRSALCRSRRELSNAYFVAKFGFDTAENEPFQVCPLSAYRSPRCQDEQQNANLLLQHCKDYINDYDSEAHADNWPYLQFVERNYNCHGFCKATGVGLWTRDGGMDACSIAVASVMRGRIQHASWQLMLYSAVVLILFLAWLAFVGNMEDVKQRRAAAPLNMPVNMPA